MAISPLARRSHRSDAKTRCQVLRARTRPATVQELPTHQVHMFHNRTLTNLTEQKGYLAANRDGHRQATSRKVGASQEKSLDQAIGRLGHGHEGKGTFHTYLYLMLKIFSGNRRKESLGDNFLHYSHKTLIRRKKLQHRQLEYN